MEQFQQIDVSGAQDKIANDGAVLLDMRDPQSFSQAHPVDAFHLSDGSLNKLISETEFDTPLIVMCYHGISSQGAAQYLLHQGFEEVYSLQGGFEAWRTVAPIEAGEAE
ncbi:thiosulfate sulfurtransferase GlpE [Agarivorans sp. MS3-6]|uniref:thiosulfate sulfurtransferase GlpE n=1 Tax=Agarivorans sp. TSD2052 TaxID=2937286 RepID=UPI00200E4CC4|nr:thiosulfate sulfurtransferase GlpE [Agarivorans sp. TSD2052]UPW18224.1 thiosulfate sulfurtransferase GlpE [Agarivorans sp. TSD2052]